MRRVEFAYPREVEGKKYQADQAAEIEAGLAADLVNEGVARYVDAPKQPAKPGVKEG